MIIIIIALFTFFVVKNHRLGVKNRSLSFGVLMADELGRYIQWDDKLATTLTLSRIIETNKNYEYLFILKDGEVFADTFINTVPADLFSEEASPPEQAYFWEFTDQNGDLHCDFVIPIKSTDAVLRMGMKQSSIDKHLSHALLMILIIGLITLIVGIFFAYTIAVAATREITMLSEGIRRYNSSNTSGKNTIKKGRSELPSLLETFQNLAAERKQVETELITSLTEKENLLSEIFHRTRNNMQLISALLYLQAEIYSDPKVDKVVEETDNKIQAMSLVHFMLNKFNSTCIVNIEDLIISTVSYLIQKYSNSISITHEIEQVDLSFDIAVPVSLILNEILSLSLLSDPATERTIAIKIKKQSGQKFQFNYSDVNMFFNKEEIYSNSRNVFGMKLISIITEDQLGGAAEIKVDGGIFCSIDIDNSYGSERL